MQSMSTAALKNLVASGLRQRRWMTQRVDRLRDSRVSIRIADCCVIGLPFGAMALYLGSSQCSLTKTLEF